MASAPSPSQLWHQADGDADRYRQLMVQHGHIVTVSEEDHPYPRCPECGVRVAFRACHGAEPSALAVVVLMAHVTYSCPLGLLEEPPSSSQQDRIDEIRRKAAARRR